MKTDADRVADAVSFADSLGVGVTPEQVVQALQVTTAFGKGVSDQQLWDYLVPVFAKSPEAQAELYSAWHSGDGDGDSEGGSAPEAVAEGKGPSVWPMIVLSAILLAALAVIAVTYFKRSTATARPTVEAIVQAERTAQQPANGETKRSRALPPPEPPQVEFERRAAMSGAALLLTALPMLLWSLAASRRRQTAAGGPPYYTPEENSRPPDDLFRTANFYGSLRTLNQSNEPGRERIDIRKTVRMTARTGLVQLAYKPLSRRPNYLALVNSSGPQDRYGQMALGLIDELKSQTIEIETAQAMMNTRTCKFGEETVSAEELKALFPLHHLLYFGTGEDLLEAGRGRFRPGTDALLAWDHRTLLSPNGALASGVLKEHLSRRFKVLTASTEHLRFIANGLPPVAPSVEQTPPAMEDAAEEAEAWRLYLADEAFQWLCAAALYPEVHWDLFLQLGSMPALGQFVLNEKNVAKLLRVPYLHRTYMPEALRKELVARLKPGVEKEARAILVDYLEALNSPSGSHAESTLRLELLFQKWQVTGTRRDRRSLVKFLRTLPLDRVVGERVVLGALLEKEPLWSHLLPRAWAKVGLPELGLDGSKAYRFSVAALSALGCGLLGWSLWPLRASLFSEHNSSTVTIAKPEHRSTAASATKAQPKAAPAATQETPLLDAAVIEIVGSIDTSRFRSEVASALKSMEVTVEDPNTPRSKSKAGFVLIFTQPGDKPALGAYGPTSQVDVAALQRLLRESMAPLDWESYNASPHAKEGLPIRVSVRLPRLSSLSRAETDWYASALAQWVRYVTQGMSPYFGPYPAR